MGHFGLPFQVSKLGLVTSAISYMSVTHTSPWARTRNLGYWYHLRAGTLVMQFEKVYVYR